MAEIAFTIIEPNGKRWAQLLEDQFPVGELITILVDRLELPKQLNYQLTLLQTNKPLKRTATLLTAGIPAGSELELSPLHDQLFIKFRDALYKEAKKQAEKQLTEKAKAELEKIRRLDPQYPDPEGIGRSLKEGVEILQQAPAKEAGQVQKQKPKAARSRLGCFGVGVIAVGGTLFIGAIAVILYVADNLDITIPDISGDPTPVVLGNGDPTPVVLGTGDVQVTLRWNSNADIDLHVYDPFGEEIWYSNRLAQSGGQLDVDANSTCSDPMAEPVENIFWPVGSAPAGEYAVDAVYYSDCGNSGGGDYEVIVRVDNQIRDTFFGTLTVVGDTHFITTFNR